MECNSKLHDAVLEGNIQLTSKLLQSKASNVNDPDDRFNGRTALHLAALRGRADLIILLLSNGADVAACDYQGNTALHWCGHEDCIEILVEHGSNVLQRNKRGLTARALAERKGVYTSVCRLLCQLEDEASLSGGHHDSFSEQAPPRRFSTASRNHLKPLWQELACDMGWRHFLLLALGLLGFSLYLAYILTGMNQGKKLRIPIDGSKDNFMVQM